MNHSGFLCNIQSILVFALIWFSSGTTQARELGQTALDRGADHCEFYVNRLGLESFQYNWSQERWLKTSVVVNPNLLTNVVGTGLYVAYEEDGRVYRELSSSSLEVGSLSSGEAERSIEFQISSTRLNMTTHKTEHVERRLLEFAYYVEAREEGLGLVRYWISNGSQNFRLSKDFDPFPQREASGGNVRRVELDGLESPVFTEKRKCLEAN